MPRLCLMQLFMPRITPGCISENLKSQNLPEHISRASCEIFDQNNYSTATPIV